MTRRDRRHDAHWADRPRAATVLAVAFLMLLIGSEVKLIIRDASESLSGAVNAQVVFELSMWALGILLVLATITRGGRLLAVLDLRNDLGPGLSVFVVIALLSWLVSYQGPAAKLTIVKSSQLVMLAAMTLWAFRWLRVDPLRVRSFWLATRRLVWAMAVVLTALTAAIPAWGARGSLVSSGDQAGFIAAGPDAALDAGRYSWAMMHPIPTGGLIGLTFILLLGALLLSDDPLLHTKRAKLLGIVALFALFALLLATKSRGPLAATIVSALAMSFVARSRSQRAYTILGLSIGAAVVSSGVLGPLWRTTILRGESIDTLRSLTGRDQIFARAIELFQLQPIDGYGYLAGRYIFLDRIPWAGESHNAIVEIAVSLGLIGLLLYALLFVRLVRYAIRRAGSSSPAAIMASEALPLLLFILTTGIVGEGFAGAVGFETLMLVWAILLTDLDRWNARLTRLRRAKVAFAESSASPLAASGRHASWGARAR